MKVSDQWVGREGWRKEMRMLLMEWLIREKNGRIEQVGRRGGVVDWKDGVPQGIKWRSVADDKDVTPD